MKKSLWLWQLGGFIFTAVAGVILHFLFDWTNESVLVAPFSAVNESIWEHMKLLFFPVLVFAIIESRYIGKDYKNFWCAKLIGIVLGTVLIPVLYYVINGAFGPTPDWVNIAIFFVSAAVSYCAETRILENDLVYCKSSSKAFAILLLIGVIFMVLTFMTPQIPIFKDPITNTYGYWKSI
ncbi:MAG: hypothetical protein IJC10_04495 [Clostridia bacterium]|nr:hypothetical protein [Clostridia bacterium]